MPVSATSDTGRVAGIAHRTPFTESTDSSLKRWLPASLYWRLRASRQGRSDVELPLLRHVCDWRKASVQIGACDDAYPLQMLIRSAKCHVFEPRRTAAASLVSSLTHRSNARLQVETVALSDRSGEARLRSGATVDAIDTITVPVRRLDDYSAAMGEVGFIRINVEGQEEEILRGACGILMNDRPALLVEVDEQHGRGSLDRVVGLLDKFGYSGFYFRDGRLHSIGTLDVATHQDVSALPDMREHEPGGINNFLFLADIPPLRLRCMIED